MYHRGMIYGLNQTLLVPEHQERYADSGFCMVRSIGKVPTEQSKHRIEFLPCVRRVGAMRVSILNDPLRV